MSEHDAICRYPAGPPCRKFSTDGTRLGADIAHEFGTTDEREIAETNAIGTLSYNAKLLSGMDAEQVDWEGVGDAE